MNKHFRRFMVTVLSAALALSLMCPCVAEVSAAENWKTWQQADSRWGDILLGGNKDWPVSRGGCTMTSLTKLIIQAGLKDPESFNVGTVVNWLNGHDGFTKEADFRWNKINKAWGLTDKGWAKKSGSYKSENYDKYFIKGIKNGYHYILGVRSGGHWVAIDEEKTLSTGKVYIMDSTKAYGKAQVVQLSKRYPTFSFTRAYKGGSTPGLEELLKKEQAEKEKKAAEEVAAIKAAEEATKAAEEAEKALEEAKRAAEEAKEAETADLEEAERALDEAFRIASEALNKSEEAEKVVEEAKSAAAEIEAAEAEEESISLEPEKEAEPEESLAATEPEELSEEEYRAIERAENTPDPEEEYRGAGSADGTSGSDGSQYEPERSWTPGLTGEVVGFSNFKSDKSYKAGLFKDVPESSWYAKNVARAYELDLMKGVSDTEFNPKGGITLAETITLAARLRSIYYSDGVDLENFDSGSAWTFGDRKWYSGYVDYAICNFIILQGKYSDYGSAATRAEFAEIMASALPYAAFEAINNVEKVPDVSENSPLGGAVYKLYRAGILTGSGDTRNFLPESAISRSEVAAIASRLADPGARERFMAA